MRRFVLILLVLVTVAVAGAVAWQLRGARVWFYTDGSSRHDLDASRVRDVLWDRAVPLPAPVNGPHDEFEPRVAVDATALLFVRGRGGADADLYTSHRSASGWDEPVPLIELNSPADELGPEPSADGRWLLFYSNRAGGQGGLDLWAARRTEDGWDAPFNLGPAVNSPHDEYGPALADDGTLYFASNRPGGPRRAAARGDDADFDIYAADFDREEGTVDAARLVASLSTIAHDGAPALTPRGDFLYFTSDREGGHGGFDLYRARRDDGEFRAPTNLGPAVNTSDDELDPCVSESGFALLFSSNRPHADAGGVRLDPDGDVVRDFDLYLSLSREVFVESERRPASIDWAALLPLLVWILLVALLLILLRLGWIVLRSRKLGTLGLLARCLIGSLIAHVILLILLTFWGVGNSLQDWLRDGRGTRVLLTSAPTGTSIESQLFGALVEIDVDGPADLETARAAAAPRPLAPAPQAEVPLPRTAIEGPEAPTMELARAEDVAAEPAAAPPMQRPALADQAATDVSAPAPAAPRAVAEAQPEARPVVERTARSAEASAPARAARPDVELPVATPAARPMEMQALAAPAAAREARTPRLAVAATAAAAPPSGAPDLRLAPAPERAAERTTEHAIEFAGAPATAARAGAATAPAERAIAAPQFVAPAASIDIEPGAGGLTEPREITDAPATRTTPPARETAVVAAAPVEPTLDLPATAVAGDGEAQLSITAPPTAPAGRRVDRVAPAAAPALVDTSSIVPAATEHDALLVAPPAHDATVRSASPAPATPAPPARAARSIPPVRLPDDAPAAVARTDTTDATPGPFRAPAARRTAPATTDGAGARPLVTITPPVASGPAALPDARLSGIEVPVAEFEEAPARMPPAATTVAASVESFEVALPAAAEAASAAAGGAEPDDLQPPPPTRQRAVTLVETTVSMVRIGPAPSASPADASVAATMSPAPAPARRSASIADRLSAPAPIDVVVATALDAGPGTSLPEDAPPPAAAPSITRRSNAERPLTPRAAAAPVVAIEPSAAALEPAGPLAPSGPVEAIDAAAATVAARPSAAAPAPMPEVRFDLALPTAPVAMPPNPYEHRAPERRRQLVETLGGSAETEAAVAAALNWFARNQEPDGRWSSRAHDARVNVDIAVTSLALLCFLAADHTHVRDGPYRETVAGAITWLLDQHRATGDFLHEESMYSHGIATIAMAEAYGMSGDPRLAPVVQSAVDFIRDARNREAGGWRYAPGQAGDTSVLGWQIMALTSARRAGFEVDEDSFAAARAWLEKVSPRNRPGLYAYQPGRGVTPAMTAEGMFVQQLLGESRLAAHMEASARYVLRHPPRWDDTANTYYWYYATLALFQRQGEEWQRWNRRVSEELLDRQRAAGAAAGSWDPADQWSDVAGRVYQTAICTLTLEVYYRYLPSFVDAPDG